VEDRNGGIIQVVRHAGIVGCEPGAGGHVESIAER
jgi:hypothetical protein